MPNILQLQDLYNESLVRELIEKTKSAAISWTHLGGTQFKASETQPSACVDPATDEVEWEFFITKSQVGTVSYKYILDVKKDSTSYITITDGPLPYTERESVAKQLYEIVELLVLELDQKVKETIRFVQDLEGALD